MNGRQLFEVVALAPILLFAIYLAPLAMIAAIAGAGLIASVLFFAAMGGMGRHCPITRNVDEDAAE